MRDRAAARIGRLYPNVNTPDEQDRDTATVIAV